MLDIFKPQEHRTEESDLQGRMLVGQRSVRLTEQIPIVISTLKRALVPDTLTENNLIN